MFIPRTLAQADPRAGRGLARALIVIALVAAALFLVLSANITVGQENLEVGQIAPRDIRAQRDTTFTSDSRTEELRAQAADEVVPVTETIKSPTDNQEDQLLAYDTMTRRVDRVLDLRDRGSLEGEAVVARLANDAPLTPVRLAADGGRDPHRAVGVDRRGRPDGPRDDPRRPVARGRPVRGPQPRPRPRHHRPRGRGPRARRRPRGRLRCRNRDHRRGGDRRADRPGPRRGPGGRGHPAGRPAHRQRGRPDHRGAVRDARRARPDPPARRGRNRVRAADPGAC